MGTTLGTNGAAPPGIYQKISRCSPPPCCAVFMPSRSPRQKRQTHRAGESANSAAANLRQCCDDIQRVREGE